jgi:subtilisin family serine protease
MPRGPQQLIPRMLLFALGLAVAAAGAAAPWSGPPRPAAATAKVTAPLSGWKAAAGGRVAVMVELAEPPAALDWAVALADKSVPKAQALVNARAAARAKITRLEPQHRRLAAALAAAPIKARELFRLKRAGNAVAVMVEPSKLGLIRALPGVKRVRVITPEYPVNATSVPFIGAPELWANTLGLPGDITGTGVRIGIIDSGIDYQHPMFGGSGLLADYQANDRVTIHPGLFPTVKVVGGTDFVGDDYDGTTTPVPDPNPTDCLGHGSHVAGTAAGFGVNADGTTYTGPYGPAPTTPFSTLRIGPGVAPGALLYSLRVFGCGGFSDVVTEAIDWAIDPNGDGDFSDHLDVINMSLGSAYGGVSDTTAQAAEFASLVGVIVAAASGNDGDTYFITSSPAAADHAISAAASVDAGVPATVLRVNAPPSIAGDYNATAAGFGGSTPPPSGQTGDVVLVHSATGTPNQGCDPNYTNAAAISGHIALISRGTCGFQLKVVNAQKAGAIGAIVFDNRNEGLIIMAGDPTQPAVTIPSVFISQADGNKIAATSGVNASLTQASAADTLAGFSSRGPRGGGSFPIRLKPDIAAPGLLITSDLTGMTCTTGGPCFVPTATGFNPGGQALTISGTSMATPHVAGTMALLRQLHPDWSVEELKALAMNGALHDVTTGLNATGSKYGLGRVGAGRVDVASSAQNQVTAFNDDDPGTVTLSFDSAVVTSADQVKQLRVVNHGAQPATFALGIDDRTVAPGVSFSLVDPTQSSLTVAGNTAVQVPVQLKADATMMQHTGDATVAPAQAAPAPLNGLGNLPRQTLTEAGSYLTFGQGGQTKLRVPLYAAPVPASAMTGTVPIPTGGATVGSSAVTVTGIGVCTAPVSGGCDLTNVPLDVVSLVTPFEAQVAHALDPTIPAFTNLQYAGVAYDAADDLLLFGISTWGPWSSPTDVSFSVFIDSQNNGTFDKVLFNSNPGTMAGSLFGNPDAHGQDTFITAFLDVPSSNVFAGEEFVNLLPGNFVDTRVFNNNVIILAVPRQDLGLAGTAFRWRVESCPGFLPLCSLLANFRDDGADGPFTWDLAKQGLDFGGNFLALDLDGASLPLNFSVDNFLANHSLGALLLHTHNTGGTGAQVLPLQGARFADLAVASSVSPATLPQKLNTPVTLTLQVSNAGPNDAHQVSVFDFLVQGGVEYLSDDSGGAYDFATGLWTVGDLHAGATATIHIKGKVVAGGEIVNTARVASSHPIDPNPENDVSTLTLNAPRLADLALTASASASSVAVGTGVTFTVNLANNGPDPSYNPRVHVILGGAKFDTGHLSVSAGSFDPISGIWQLGSLPAGVTETLQFRVVPHHAGAVGIHAEAFASTPDPNLINNHAAKTVTVH